MQESGPVNGEKGRLNEGTVLQFAEQDGSHLGRKGYRRICCFDKRTADMQASTFNEHTASAQRRRVLLCPEKLLQRQQHRHVYFRRCLFFFFRELKCLQEVKKSDSL